MATAHHDLAAMPVIRDLAEFDPRSGSVLERLVFNHRFAMIAVCAVITAVLAWAEDGGD